MLTCCRLMNNIYVNKNQAGLTTSGLQTTPSPQLMNYVDFEGQELIITKQLNKMI